MRVEEDVSETSEASDTGPEKPLSSFSTSKNNIKPSPATIGTSGANKSKTSALQKNGGKRGRVVPMPVAPPRLPSSATNSTAVTPTASFGLRFMTGGSSFDDSHFQDNFEVSAGNNNNNHTSGDDGKCSSALDLEQSQLLGETRTRSSSNRRQISKLFSLQSDSVPDSGGGFLPDISSLVSGGIAALEDAFGKI